MLNITIYEWVGVNSHSMSWPARTGPGLYKQIVVLVVDQIILEYMGHGLRATFLNITPPNVD